MLRMSLPGARMAHPVSLAGRSHMSKISNFTKVSLCIDRGSQLGNTDSSLAEAFDVYAADGKELLRPEGFLPPPRPQPVSSQQVSSGGVLQKKEWDNNKEYREHYD